MKGSCGGHKRTEATAFNGEIVSNGETEDPEAFTELVHLNSEHAKTLVKKRVKAIVAIVRTGFTPQVAKSSDLPLPDKTSENP